MAIRMAAPIAMALLLAGCGSIGALNIPVFNRSQEPPPLAPAELPPVETAALPPPGQGAGQQDPFLPQTGGAPPPATTTGPQPTPGEQQIAGQPPLQTPSQAPLQQPVTSAPPDQQVAAVQPSSGLGRTDLLGGWTITSAGDSCQLFMTLTSWTGGYRASTRGCASDTLKAISAWDLKGNQVVLSGQGGSPVARLFSSGGGRFDGQTESGAAPVSFYR